MISRVLIALSLTFYVTTAKAEIIVLDYPGFILWHDCEIGGAVAARYEIGPDTDNIDRSHSFHLDPDLPDGCKQQTDTEPYPSTSDAPYKYDRGHLVPANHLDNNEDAIAASNVMTNITPQHRAFNRSGAWRETEKRIECWRDEADKGPLIIWIGVDWGDDNANDHFTETHGIITPDRFVKVVYRPITKTAIAWDLPNGPIKAGQLNDHVAEPSTAEGVIGVSLALQGVDMSQKADAADWPKLSCDQS